jgi:hypothetical protein
MDRELQEVFTGRAPFPNQTTVLSWWHIHNRMVEDNWLIYSDPQCIITRQLPSPKSWSYFWDICVCACSDGKYLWTDKKHKGGRETERARSEREKWEQARGHWDKQRQPKEETETQIETGGKSHSLGFQCKGDDPSSQRSRGGCACVGVSTLLSEVRCHLTGRVS